MTTGLRGTFVIGCSQTEVDGIRSAEFADIAVGSLWRWTGFSVCVDAPGTAIVLGEAFGVSELRRRAGRRIRHMFSDTSPQLPHDPTLDPGFSRRGGLVITDGLQIFRASIMGDADSGYLYVFEDRMPPIDRDLWVSDIVRPRPSLRFNSDPEKKLVCFGRGTKISTPNGRRPVETLAPGDLVETRDNGPQQIAWTGFTDITRKEVDRCPNLAPVWIRPGAFGPGSPGDGLFVSGGHRLLVQGAHAQDLFLTPEVLASADQLVDDARIRRAKVLRAFRYHHIMLESHQVVWANGLACETFHPADMDLLSLGDQQRLAMLEIAPDAFKDPAIFGTHARRCLTSAEASILRYANSI